MRRWSQITNATLCTAFLLVISMPFTANCIWPDRHQARLVAKLRAAAQPGTLSHVPLVFKKHFEQHFAFRETLVQWHGVVKARWLGVSTRRDLLVGKSEWLFWGDPATLDVYQRAHAFSSDELRQCQRDLEWRRDWLAARNIRYLYFLAPEKQTIYPEMMPGRIQVIGRRSRLDQVIEHMKLHSDFQLLDVRPALLAAKQQNQVYRKYDSHWNSSGAFAVSGEIARAARQWFPEIKPLTWEDVEPVPSVFQGDLAALLGLREVLKDDECILKPREEFQAMFTSTNLAESGAFVRADAINRPHVPERRALVFGDCFMEELKPYLAAHFQTVVFIHSSEFDTKMVEALDPPPQIVIHQRVERKMGFHPFW